MKCTTGTSPDILNTLTIRLPSFVHRDTPLRQHGPQRSEESVIVLSLTILKKRTIAAYRVCFLPFGNTHTDFGLGLTTLVTGLIVTVH